MESSGMDLRLSTCIYTNHGGGFWDGNQYKTSRRYAAETLENKFPIWLVCTNL